jgi:DEAD/DEAH box helicase domain-containing protein
MALTEVVAEVEEVPMTVVTPVDPAPRAHPDLLQTTLAALAVPPVATLDLVEQPGITGQWPVWADPDVIAALADTGIDRPWQHQVEAAELAHDGRNVVIATGTASGKSIGYWLPALTAIARSQATTLYITPTKALAQDQRARLRGLQVPGLAVACYDGDTSPEDRPLIRNRATYVLTNPDMLHRSILPRHSQWSRFLRRLQYVVLDESHTYRGVFGCHMSAVLRRLRRLAALHGSQPVFIVSSATLSDAGASAAQLISAECHPVTTDTSRRGATRVVLCDPSASTEPASAFAETAAALTAWSGSEIRSLGFIRSRAGAESLARAVGERLGPGHDHHVTAYRGGLLPEERRTIEQRLRAGDLRCVATTNALELGVDISGLDAVALCGWPGTRAAFLQQIGRAGRSGGTSVAVLIANEDPLDRYFVHHPERLLADAVEGSRFDPDNPHVVLPHLACAIAESPMTDDEAVGVFGAGAPELLEVLRDREFIRRRSGTWYWVARGRAAELTDLRGCGTPVTIIEQTTGRVLGTVDGTAAPASVHQGAVYVHLGRTHVVESLDLEQHVATVVPAEPGYTTVAQRTSDLRISGEAAGRPLGAGNLHFGDVAVTSRVVGFLKRQAGTGAMLGAHPLELPEQRLTTKAAWWRIPSGVLQTAGLRERDLPGAAHAAEHASIGVLPALATCDRWDIGGLSTVLHPDTGDLTVFVYDGYPGGAGFARYAFDHAEAWLSGTRDVIAACECDRGCPGCVQSPKCGNGNNPLDKAVAVALLTVLLS